MCERLSIDGIRIERDKRFGNLERLAINLFAGHA